MYYIGGSAKAGRGCDTGLRNCNRKKRGVAEEEKWGNWSWGRGR